IPKRISRKVDTGFSEKGHGHSRTLEHVPIPTERDMLQRELADSIVFLYRPLTATRENRPAEAKDGQKTRPAKPIASILAYPSHAKSPWGKATWSSFRPISSMGAVHRRAGTAV